MLAIFLFLVFVVVSVCPCFTVVESRTFAIAGCLAQLDALIKILDFISGLPALDVHLWRGS